MHYRSYSPSLKKYLNGIRSKILDLIPLFEVARVTILDLIILDLIHSLDPIFPSQ